MNPFLLPLAQASPLREDTQQQLYFDALLKGVKQGLSPETPAHLPLDRLGKLLSRGGPESLLTHPADLETIFAGVTQAVYRAIAELYCTPLGRSIPTVWRIVQALAREAGVAPPSYEATWAICLSFDKQRRDLLTARLERGADTWWLGQVTLGYMHREADQQNAPMLSTRLCFVMKSVPSQVLACELATEETVEEKCALAFYAALVAQRRPHSTAPYGLTWSLPCRLVTTGTLPRACRRICRALGITLESQSELPGLALALQANWAAALAGRTLVSRKCLLLLEAYLTRHAPPGPLHLQEDCLRQYGQVLSYRRDPAWSFPLLRTLLPERRATVSEEGTLVFPPLHYDHPLLVHWPNTEVIMRFSPTSGALAWVYLEGEILCQAAARERRSQVEHYQALHEGEVR